MLAMLRAGLVVTGLFTLLLGIVVPVLFTGFAGAVLAHQAGGSLVVRDGKVVGSSLIGQGFSAGRYFHPRPSATSEPDPDKPGSTRPAPYNAAASGGSNLGPTSAGLLSQVQLGVAAEGRAPVPADAVTASGSGLDPHISPANAARQVARVAAARGLDPARLEALVAANTQGPEFGILGEPRVNVLRLNLALDALR
ncbi:MAG: potassium-transporting ATPase subunit KdpC [Acetobacteraceae bacterium]|nr:potassium-transporting ATPase subunit KdpC [Acetobacteraceae bacterium]